MTRSPAPVPGPLRRVLRDRIRVAAVALLAVAAVAVAGIQGGAAAALRASLDADWRGVYDILVVPASANAPIDGMLPPNSLGSGTSGIGVELLEQVRGIEGVEIAAPLGEIVAPGLKALSPTVAIPRGIAGAGTVPQAFRVSAVYTTDDGLGERVVGSTSTTVVVDESSATRPRPECRIPESTVFNSLPLDPARYPHLARALFCRDGDLDGVAQRYPGGWGFQPATDELLMLTLDPSAQGATRITLVDPVAEKALLGDAGAFLDPLIALGPTGALSSDDVAGWARADTGRFGPAYLDDRSTLLGLDIIYGQAGLADARALYREAGRDFDEEMSARLDGVGYLPLLVTDAPAAALSVKVTVTALGAAPYIGEPGGVSWPYAEPSAPAAPTGEPLGTVVVDISDALNPLVDGHARIAWPGAELDTVDALPQFRSLAVNGVARPVDGRYAHDASGIALAASGYRAPLEPYWTDPGEPFSFDIDPTAVGAEAVYLDLEQRGERAEGIGTVAVPVGTFPRDGIVTTDAVDYVPLGAYTPVDTVVSGGAHEGVRMRPSVSGIGLVSPATIAIGSLDSAASWGDAAPISAIRVRVAGIDGYTPEAQRAVLEVAERIQGLGLRAVVVAGSSPAPVTVRVDGYAFGTDDPDGAQAVGVLGAISQNWSELGAAARAELAISSSTVVIALIGVGAALLLLGAAQFAGLPRRREESATMRALGFSRSRIARWHAAEEAPGLLVIVATAGTAALLVQSTLTGALLLAVVVATLALVGAAVVAGSRPEPSRALGRRRSGRMGARTVRGFGARQALLHPVTSLTQFVAVVIVGAAAAGLASLVLRGRAEAGESLLAGALGDQQLLPQLALGAVSLSAGIVLAVLSRRQELLRRADQWSALRTTGWTSRQIARAQRIESAAILLPAAAVTAALVAIGAPLLALPSPALLVAASAVGASAAATTILTVRTRGTRA